MINKDSYKGETERTNLNFPLTMDETEDPIIAIGEDYAWAQPGRFKDINIAVSRPKTLKGWRKFLMQLALLAITNKWAKEVCV